MKASVNPPTVRVIVYIKVKLPTKDEEQKFLGPKPSGMTLHDFCGKAVAATSTAFCIVSIEDTGVNAVKLR